MKKIIKSATLFVACIWLVYGCCQDEPIPVNPTPVGCPDMYDVRSKPYANPYLGTLKRPTPFPTDNVYPERYQYWYPRLNPNNEYQICYCRIDNTTQFLGDMDLFTYDFCSGTAKKVATNVMGWPDWSIKDWIVFTKIDGNIWKIKSNGDSLTKLTNDGRSDIGVWSPDGELLALPVGTRVIDERGNTKYTITNCGALIGWLDNENIINIFAGSRDITKMNVTTNQLSSYLPYNGYAMYKYQQKTNEIIGSIDTLIRGEYAYKGIIYDATAHSVKYLNNNFVPNSFVTLPETKGSKRILAQQYVKDTMTDQRHLINFRSHIAIMNLDGSNLRQVLLPE